jgi:hypothetical protein
MSRTYTPIHEDKDLTDTWWAERGYTIGKNLWYNAIRDGSGRFNGYCMLTNQSDHVFVKTVAEAEAAIKQSGIFPSI